MCRAEQFYSGGTDTRQREIITFRTDKETRDALNTIAEQESETVSNVLRSMIVKRAVLRTNETGS